MIPRLAHLVLVVLAFSTQTCCLAQFELSISPEGNDLKIGVKKSPYASPGKAIEN